MFEIANRKTWPNFCDDSSIAIYVNTMLVGILLAYQLMQSLVKNIHSFTNNRHVYCVGFVFTTHCVFHERILMPLEVVTNSFMLLSSNALNVHDDILSRSLDEAREFRSLLYCYFCHCCSRY